MKISLIVALSSNRVIGLDNKMPWHLSADLKKFKQITMGYPIIMGRKTFESIGKALPGRSNIIISRNTDYQQGGCLVFGSLDAALRHACTESARVFVIGGASLYEALLPLADELYLTEIQQEFAGDTFFPEVRAEEWREVAREDIADDPQVTFSYSFLKLIRVLK
ncbi:MAG: dihydrofolate reductase [Methylovulum sp.]|uniref:dihydrofolate reductase n=1 Tax=Methylovulum sp. TaxID=1916980 RepID=UPI00260A04C6|nr:dihydrofolate reductase [Methylovulum sp.]MDD2722967.1 dihydrofolate reductase [Methylovulum sp.]MDD5123280.1 dihydrofolate reductase [Methylovulum sp.]